MSWDLQAAHDRRLIGNLTAEQKLWACVILKAIADQDPSLTTDIPRQANRLEASRHARAWLRSPEFYSLCDMSGIAHEILTGLTPQQAALLYYKLVA